MESRLTKLQHVSVAPFAGSRSALAVHSPSTSHLPFNSINGTWGGGWGGGRWGCEWIERPNHTACNTGGKGTVRPLVTLARC